MVPGELPDLQSPHLEFTRTGPVAWLTIDRAVRRNSLTMQMYRAIGRAISVVEDDPSLGALVITGVEDVFIVGGDMTDHGSITDDEGVGLPFAQLLEGTVPVVAAINGHCQASGTAIAVLADVAIASDRARFRFPELRLGVAAPWSAAVLPAVVGLGRAKELALTGRSIDAHEAVSIGLIGRVVDHEELRAAAMQVALDLLEAGPTARLAWKRAVHAQLSRFTDADTERSFTTPEAHEGFAAFLERRPPSWSPRT